MDGILNVNKPWGKTSYSIVAMVKRLTGEQRVGHAGTLDPAATGVLPICLGQGTRVVEFFLDATKAYLAEVEFGVATDTYDASGKVIQEGDPSKITREQLASLLPSFCGLLWQTPPMYSAIKHQGKPLYQLARAGITIERRSRPVKIHRLELTDWQAPVATLEIVCGRGTYIRSLAHDLGQALGCGAHLKSLVRLRYGPFHLKDAVPASQLEDVFRHGYWQQFVHPVDSVISHWPAMIVGDDAGHSIGNGRPFVLGNGGRGDEGTGLEARLASEPSSGIHSRAYDLDGRFLGVLRFNSEKGEWQPEKVFPAQVWFVSST